MDFAWDLNATWYVLVGVLLTGYAILDGFDLGVGALHLLTRGDRERRVMINSIGPVWDGNEVWLITGGGALFAAFPHVYATVFSGFYTAFMILLAVLIFRAVAIEFRSKEPMGWWRRMWDVSFSLASILIALLAGVALGNMVLGIPIGADKEFTGTFFSLLRPYALLVGLTTVALFTMHGAIYVVMKTEGEFQARVRGWINNTIIIFVICYISLTMVTLVYVPHMVARFRDFPPLMILGLLTMLAVANIPREITKGREFRAFLSSCATIAGLMGLFGIGLFPNFVISSTDPSFSLNIHNAASSAKTLRIMLTIAIIGIPFVLAYTSSIYWIFRGKVKLDSMSY
jgi:cytochrome d ubiquinol oxidase subunit II